MEIAEYRKMYELEGKYWWWVGRRLIFRNILGKLNMGRTTVILDVGCGTGINLDWLKEYGSVTGLDISKYALDFCKRRGHNTVIQGDAESLPFPSNRFDIMMALDILEHLDDDKALEEFHRVLKPNGYLVLNVPAFNSLWSRHDEALHHKRRYNKAQLTDIIESKHFRIKRLSYWNFFLFLPVAMARLMSQHRKNREIRTDLEELPNVVNDFLAMILRIESHLLQRINLPVGVSLMCVAKADK